MVTSGAERSRKELSPLVLRCSFHRHHERLVLVGAAVVIKALAGLPLSLRAR
jgi:hypothetical protein